MNFHLAKNSSGQYLCGIDQDNNPIFTDDYDQALWSWNHDRLQGYISSNSLSDTSIESADEGGVAPPNKPPF